MATAAKLVVTDDCKTPGKSSTLEALIRREYPELSVAEEWEQFTGEEISAASTETSNKFNGIVLSKAVVIVQCRIKCLSLQELAKRTGIGKNAMYRFARGGPASNTTLRHALRDLAAFLDEQ